MGLNDGAGPDDQATCTQVAGRLERLLVDEPSVFAVASSLWVDPNGRFLSKKQAALASPDRLSSPYRVDREFVQQWSEFLRHCGGFAVW